MRGKNLEQRSEEYFRGQRAIDDFRRGDSSVLTTDMRGEITLDLGPEDNVSSEPIVERA